MGLTFQIPSAVFPLLFCEGVAAGIFAGLALFTGIHGVISRRRAFYAFSCHSPPVGSPHFVLLVTNLCF